MGEVAATLAEAVSVGVGEQRAGSIVGEAGEAVWWASRASRLSQMWVRQAVAWRTAAAC